MPAATVDPGRLGSLDQIACITQSVVSDGPAAGCRAIDLRVYGGIDVRVLPDRGCDIGAAWYAGVPLAWLSPVGERGPFPLPGGAAWDEAFSGGFVTTCGLRNVGAAADGLGVHGAYSQQRATILGAERCEGPDGALSLKVRARVREVSALGWNLELERTIVTHVGEGRLELVDVTRNLGREPEPAPLLYHVNVGAPLWGPGARVAVAGHEQAVPRDADAAVGLATWEHAPEPVEGPERVFEHVFAAGPDGRAHATVANDRVGLELSVEWDAGTLPRLHQWVHPAPGIYAFGLEPANCSVLGRAADRADGRLPVLEPGEERRTQVDLAIRSIPKV